MFDLLTILRGERRPAELQALGGWATPRETALGGLFR
jgi:hypothetical protein